MLKKNFAVPKNAKLLKLVHRNFLKITNLILIADLKVSFNGVSVLGLILVQMAKFTLSCALPFCS